MLLMGALGELVEVGIRTGIWLASFTRIFWSVMPWLDHSLWKPKLMVGVEELWAKVVEMKESLNGCRA